MKVNGKINPSVSYSLGIGLSLLLTCLKDRGRFPSPSRAGIFIDELGFSLGLELPSRLGVCASGKSQVISVQLTRADSYRLEDSFGRKTVSLMANWNV